MKRIGMKNKDIIKLCEVHLEEFNRFDVPNIFKKSREGGFIEYRQLFQTILRNKLKLSYRSICEYMEHKGHPITHASIINNVRRTIESNYYAYPDIANIYDYYFDDKIKQREKKEYNKRYYQRIKYAKNDRLWELVRNIPEDKEQEIIDLVSLRIKSWEWKTKDSCKVYNGIEGISDNVF